MSSFRIVLGAILAWVVSADLVHSQMIVAHRGASHDAPENTLAAFRLAWDQGSDGIEGDFFLTADFKIVCIHDRDTQRTGGKNLLVEESSLQELRELEYGGWKAEKWRGEQLPTLDQVLETVPEDKTFVIELKSKIEVVAPLVADLRRRDTSNIRLMIIAFDEETAGACKKFFPEARVHWLTRFRDGHPTAKEIAATVKRLGVDGVGMKAERQIITGDFIDELRAAGCQEFHVWTVDDVDDAVYFQQLGAMGVTTNVPAIVGKRLRKGEG